MKMSLAVKTRRAVEADVPALIDLAQRSWLSGNCELAHDRCGTGLDGSGPRDEAISGDMAERHGCGAPVHESSASRMPTAGRSQNCGFTLHFRDGASGSRLLQACEQEILHAGYDTSRLQYSEYNVAAPHFYRARGYVEVSRSRGRLPSGVERDIIVMEKRLNT